MSARYCIDIVSGTTTTMPETAGGTVTPLLRLANDTGRHRQQSERGKQRVLGPLLCWATMERSPKTPACNKDTPNQLGCRCRVLIAPCSEMVLCTASAASTGAEAPDAVIDRSSKAGVKETQRETIVKNTIFLSHTGLSTPSWQKCSCS